jgi:phosphoglycolate phosphatase
MRIMNLLFDLDGTLVDTLPGIEYSCRAAASAILPQREFPGLRGRIGPPIREIFQKIFLDLTPDTLDGLENRFRASYDTEGWLKSEAYPQVAETLTELRRREVRCFVVTNKPALATGRILEHVGLRQYFDQAVSPDSRPERFASKAEAIAYLLEQHELKCDDSWFVGDSKDDADAAKACTLRFIAVVYGYGEVAQAAGFAAGRYALITKFSQLLQLIDSGNTAAERKD